MRFLMIALGGALGALLRYAVSGWAHRLTASGFPWGTLSVNLLGSFAIGLLWAVSERSPFPAAWSFFLFVGLLGAFTTYSTFALETVNLWRDGELLIALGNLVLSSTGSVIMAALGLVFGRALFGG